MIKTRLVVECGHTEFHFTFVDLLNALTYTQNTEMGSMLSNNNKTIQNNLPVTP